MVFSVYSGFLHQLNWPPRYYWNIVESGVKQHNPPTHQPQLRCIHKRKFLKGRYYLLCAVNHLIVFCFIVCLRQVSSSIAICMYETCLHTINQQHDDIRMGTLIRKMLPCHWILRNCTFPFTGMKSICYSPDSLTSHLKVQTKVYFILLFVHPQPDDVIFE